MLDVTSRSKLRPIRQERHKVDLNIGSAAHLSTDHAATQIFGNKDSKNRIGITTAYPLHVCFENRPKPNLHCIAMCRTGHGTCIWEPEEDQRSARGSGAVLKVNTGYVDLEFC